MSIADGTSTYMPVVPANSNGFGGDWAWIIILLLAFGGGFGGMSGNNSIYPWMNQADITTNGFQNAATNAAVGNLQNSVTSGFGDIQTALCGGFASVNAAIAGANTANLERSYGVQTAISNGINAVSSQLAQCCCENRSATIQTQNVVQAEGAATRAAIQAQTQAILDKMCQQEIDNLKAANVSLQNQVNMQNLAASQTAQTAALIADNTAQTQYLLSKLTPATAAA